MRSEPFHIFKQNLSRINNYLSNFIFINEQFLIAHRKNQEKASKIFNTEGVYTIFTEDIYCENKYTSQFNVSLDVVEQQSLETICFIFDSILVFCFLEFENYLKELYKRIQNIQNLFKNKDVHLNKKLTDELKDLNTNQTLATVLINLNIAHIAQGKSLKIRLNSDSQYLQQEDFETLEYLRLRRNTLVHRDIKERYKGTIKDFIEEKENKKEITKGDMLNAFWADFKKSKVKISALKFDNKELILTSHLEVIDIINIIREASKRIDFEIMNLLDEEDWLLYLYSCFQEEEKRFDYTIIPKFVAKFNGFAKKKINHEFETNFIVTTLKLKANQEFNLRKDVDINKTGGDRSLVRSAPLE